jgi:hypothetical protein
LCFPSALPLAQAYFCPQYGEVVDACVMVDSTNGRPRGFGFVSFASATAVQRVIEAGRYHRIGERDVDVKPAVPRDVLARGEVSMEAAKPRRHASANAKGFGDEKAAMMTGNEMVGKLSSAWYPPQGIQEGVWHGMSPASAAAPAWVMPGVMWPAAVAAPGAMAAPAAMMPQPMVPHMPSGVTHGVPVYGGYAPMAYAAAPMGMGYVPPAAPYRY